MKVITKQFIIDQLTDNEVDLSMNELSDVPVKELVYLTSVANVIKIHNSETIGSCYKGYKIGLI